MKSEGVSSVDQIIARSPNETKEADMHFAKEFYNQKDEKNLELKKSQWHIKIINLVNEETNKLLEKYGLERFDISSDHVHLFSDENYEKIMGENSKNPGYFIPEGQTTVQNQNSSYSKTIFADRIWHEYIHFKSHQNVLAQKKESESDAADYSFSQVGIRINLGKGEYGEQNKELTKNIPNAEDVFEFIKKEQGDPYRYFFHGLNEAITEELTRRFQKNTISKIPEFAEEAENIKKFVENAKIEGKKINENEIVSIAKKITYSPDNKKEYVKTAAIRASYRPQRKALNLLIEKVYNKNRDKFQDREEVFDLFAKSIFTGNIVGKDSWGRLVEKTFGNGALKQLAVKDGKELKKFVENLNKNEN